MHSVQEALAVIAGIVHPATAETVAAIDAARGLFLAQDILMDQDSPPFDRAQLDGYAVVAADAPVGAELQVIGRVDAGGRLFAGSPQPGQCVAINTGGVVPAWADAVVMVEHTKPFERDGAAWIHTTRAASAGYGIQRKGADVRAGEVVLGAGSRMLAPQLAICAAAGAWTPLVRRVKVGVLSTGDELMDGPDAAGAPGHIRNSNGPMLRALAAEAGGVPVDLGTSRDEVGAIREHLKVALDASDLLIVCGGMSMGTRDHVPGLLKELGVAIHIEKVRIKPGKPFIFGVREADGRRTYVAGLPGNPVSAYVTFQRFVREAIARLGGSSAGGLRPVRARAGRALEVNGDREFFQPCKVTGDDAGCLTAEPLKWKGSADLFTLAHADGLIVRPADAPAVAANEVVDVLVW